MKKMILLLSCAMFCITLNAQPFKKFRKKLTKWSRPIVKPLSAPTRTVIKGVDIVRGKAKAKTIIEPYRDAVRANASIIPNLVSGINYPQKVMMRNAQEFSSRVGGNAGSFIFDVGTFTNRYYPELTYALARNVKDVAYGKTPFQVVGTPLSAAIRSARASHWKNSKPIPNDVKKALRGYYSDEVLDNARYAIGKIEITLPTIINRVVMLGEPHAVTVGDLIVFSTDPGPYNESFNGARWWRHELRHVAQYDRLGIENFSFRYMIDFGRSLEKDATDYANSIVFSN